MAIIVTEYLLIHIAIKVEGLDGNVGASQSPLEACPEVFNALSMVTAMSNVSTLDLRLLECLSWERLLSLVEWYYTAANSPFQPLANPSNASTSASYSTRMAKL